MIDEPKEEGTVTGAEDEATEAAPEVEVEKAE